MANAAPAENMDRELTCTICLDTFDCPSTLSCGHSFCLQCLEDAWKETDTYCCPQCRKTFPRRPQLTRNVTLANLIEQLRLTEAMAAASPDVNPEERKCKRHKQELIFYCKQDVSLVCTVCALTGEHRGHDVGTLEDEHKTRKGRVGEEMRAVEKDRKKAEASVGQMKATRKDVQDCMVQTKAHISGEFARMRAMLDDDEKTALDRVDVKGGKLLSRIEENIAHYEREISDLKAAATRLRALQEERDSLTFLQVHLKETNRRGAQKEAPHSSPSKEDMATIGAQQGALIKLLPFMYGRSPTLDPNSAHNELQISWDLRTVTRTAVSQGLPNHPHRFYAWSQALCSESFSSGQHYWEVDLGGATGSCMVGVAYGTIARKGSGKECLLGHNDSSWVLRIDNNCSVRHGGVETSVPVRDPPRRVGCHLHWEAGLLSFYRADSMELLHSVHRSFSQPLFPALYVWGDGSSVRILDLSRAS